MVVSSKFVLPVFVSAATSSTMMFYTLGSPTRLTILFGYFPLNIGVDNLADVS
jgi:hypothetical protein